MSIRPVCLVIVAFTLSLSVSAFGQCLSDNLDGLCCQPMTPNLPSFPSLSLGVKYICWDECDARLSRDVCLVLGAPTRVRIGGASLEGVYRITFTARTCAGGANANLWTGSLIAHYSRTWLESSVPGPSPNTGVWRFLLNGDLTPTARVIQLYGQNTCAVPPCNATFGHFYVQGYVDYARNCQTGQWSAAGTVYHGCDAEVHGPTSGRPAPPSGFHTRSYSWVWPAAGFVPYSSAVASPRSEGTAVSGAVRFNDWRTRPGIARAEENVLSGEAVPVSELCNCTSAGSPNSQYISTQISNGAAACGSIFQTSGGVGLLQKRIGRWTAATFPGAEHLLLDFGSLDHVNACNGLATTEYFEGVETIGGFSATNHASVALAPQFEDLASSNSSNLNTPIRSIGKTHLSWYLINLNLRAAFDVRWAVDADGFWDVPSNWSTGAVPGPNDRVLIDRPAGNFTITVRQPGAVAERILSEERLTIATGADLTVTGTVQVNNEFTLDGGTLASAMVLPGSGGQGLTVTTTVGPARLSAVTMDASVSIPDSALLRITNGLTLNGTITNSSLLEFFGAQTLSGMGQVVFGPGTGPKAIRPLGGTLTIGPSISVHGESGTVGQAGAAFTNQGTIRAATSGVTMSLVGSSWLSTGTIQATGGGSLDLGGSGWTNAGSLSITGGGSLDLSGTWTNTGTVSMTESTVNFGGTFASSDLGSVNRSGGTVNVTGTLNNTSLSLNATTGSWHVSGGTIVGGTVATSGGATLIAAGGTLDDVTLNGALSIPDGTSMTVTHGLTLNGTVTLSSAGAGATLIFSGAQTLSGTGEIVLSTSSSTNVVRPSLGTLTIAPSMTIRGSGGTVGQAGLAFVNRGAIRAQSSVVTITLTGTTWSNEGTLAATGGGRLATSGTWSTSGTVSIPSGCSLTATGSYVQTAGQTVVDGNLTTTGSVSIQGGTLGGTGTINGNVTSAGSVSPGSSAGTLTVAGTFAQQSAGSLNVELGGLTPGTIDRLIASGAVTLDGTLNVSLIGGFQPAIGDQFVILSGTSVNGTFSATNGLDVGIGRRIQVIVNPTNVTLQVTRVFTIEWAVDSDGFWDVPSNWSPARVPNSTDNVLIDRPAGDFTITVRQTGAAAFLIHSEERFAVDEFGGTAGGLTLGGTIQVNNTFTLNGGSLVNANVLPGSGGQGVTVTCSTAGVTTLTAVRLDCDLTTPPFCFINVTGGLTLNGSITITQNSALQFNGTQTLGGSGEVIFTSGSIFAPGGPLTVDTGITIRGTPGAAFTFSGDGDVLRGTLLADQAGQSVQINGAGWSNQGTIVAANGGSLQLYGSNWTNTGSVSISGGGTLELGYPGFWTNTGTISMTNSTVFLGGSFTLASLGNFTRSGGVVRLTGILDNTSTNLVLDATTGPWLIQRQDNNPINSTILGGTVTVTPQAALTANSGILDGVTLFGEFTVNPFGGITVRNGWTLDGTAFLSQNSFINFSGSQTLTGSGDIVFAGGYMDIGSGTLTIGAGITIRGVANSRGNIGNNASTTAFVNLGTIRSDQPGQMLSLNGGGWSNMGTIEASNGGSIGMFGSNWTNSGSVSISGGGTLWVGGLENGSSVPTAWHNTGTIAMTGSTVRFGGRFANADIASFTRIGGSVLLLGTLDNTSLVLDATSGSWFMINEGGQARINGGTVTVTSPAQFTVDSGRLDGITVNGDFTMTGGGNIDVTNGITLNGTFTILKAVNFLGTQTVSGTGAIEFGGNNHVEISSGTLTVGSGITVRCQPNRTARINGAIVNQGTLRVDATGKLIRIQNASVTNDGTIECTGGGRIETAMALSTSGSVTIASGSELVVESGTFTQTAGVTQQDGVLTGTLDLQGGTLRGSGTTGTVANSAVVSPGSSAGTLSVAGNYTQLTGGSLNVELGGTATTAFDRLLATGVAMLDGSLNVSLINGFQPSLGQTFTILTFASRTGTFANTSGLDLGGGLQLQVNVNPTDVTLEVVASP
ncbi:MAG: hypothetical protein HY292_09885 [Planctomycetes bacterium]|nr:hypothetical protein [Planctomycetota bacterium]